MGQTGEARSRSSQRVEIDGHELKLTSLDKVLYPDAGTTKADVIAYYAAVADVMVPHLRGRPVTRKRWVDGVGTLEQPGSVFFEKNLGAGVPPWVDRVEVQHRARAAQYPIVTTAATLAWFGQVAALELHVPQWRFTPAGEPGAPDRLVLDLDPGPGVGLLECAFVAAEARRILRDIGLDPIPVTSGSKGIHLYSALDGTRSSDVISGVAKELARALEADHPDVVVSSMAKARREGKVLLDWSQNSASKTTVAPYSLRGRSRPTVAVPRTWRELASPTLRHLELDEVARRVRRRGDLLAPLLAVESRDPRHDRLSTYRSMRDPDRTPEPVPVDPPSVSPTDGTRPRFVIQEHHARRSHWDLRLEREGVLASWALPKGMPLTRDDTRLAVPTEDHPLEYADFEGTIPPGEYGAGEMTIWDSGHYELEKWRADREVIVTLHSDRRGARRIALIRTGDEQWLAKLLDEAGARAARPSRRRTVSGSARAEADRPTAPMLATPGSADDIAPDDEWSFEMKWDGIRIIATVDDESVMLRTRNGIDVTASYPELAELSHCVDGSAVLDGELVALDRSGRPAFGRLQRRMGLTSAREIAAARAKQPVALMLFDVLEAGEPGMPRVSLLAATYDERRRLLADRTRAGTAVQLPSAFDGDLEAAMATGLELGLEGVVAKRRTSTYRPGKRSRDWIKLKHERTQSVIVCGWRPGRGARASVAASLLLAVPDDDGLRYVGRVGTGFDERTRRDLAVTLERRRRSTPPVHGVPAADAADAHWVTPRRVGEVAFAEWTESGRLRHATWRGWRTDLTVEDVTIESSREP